MIFESFGILLVLALLMLVGLGPALWLLGADSTRFKQAVGVAPGVAVMLLNLVGIGLVRFIAPVERWALPLTLVLLVLSAGLVFVWFKRNKGALELVSSWRSWILPIVALLGCYLVLSAPLWVNGIQYGAYRSNPSDAYTYISLAESLRHVPWQTILSGVNFTPDNLPHVRELAAASPSAIYTARAVGFPLQLNNMVTLAWFSQILGVAPYAAYYAYHLLSLLNAFVLAAVLGTFLGLPRGLKYLVAATIAVGFWARFVLETDAEYEITSVALLLLVIIAWVNLEEFAPDRILSFSRLFLALAAAVLACNYLVLVPLVVLAFLIYYAVAIVRRERSFRALLLQGITALLALLILALTGQLDLVYYNFLYSILNVPRQRLFEPTVLNIWSANGLNAVWGLGTTTLLGAQRALLQLPLTLVSNALALVLTGLLIVAGWFSLARSRRAPAQVIFAMVVAGLVVMLWAVLSGNLRAVGKSFTYSFPYIALGVAAATLYMQTWSKWLRVLATGAVAVWCVAQILIGAALPFSTGLVRVFSYPKRTEQYDLSALTRYLDANPPQLLAVNIPRSNRWEFPFYAMMVFAKYPVTYQSGIILDNNVQFKNIWLDAPQRAPDYIVIAKEADYVDANHLGTRVAETPDLALYRVTVPDVSVWNAHTAETMAAESSKADFVPSIPMLFPTP